MDAGATLKCRPLSTARTRNQLFRVQNHTIRNYPFDPRFSFFSSISFLMNSFDNHSGEMFDFEKRRKIKRAFFFRFVDNGFVIFQRRYRIKVLKQDLQIFFELFSMRKMEDLSQLDSSCILLLEKFDISKYFISQDLFHTRNNLIQKKN